jgi:hypothetical protein
MIHQEAVTKFHDQRVNLAQSPPDGIATQSGACWA